MAHASGKPGPVSPKNPQIDPTLASVAAKKVVGTAANVLGGVRPDSPGEARTVPRQPQESPDSPLSSTGASPVISPRPDFPVVGLASSSETRDPNDFRSHFPAPQDRVPLDTEKANVLFTGLRDFQGKVLDVKSWGEPVFLSKKSVEIINAMTPEGLTKLAGRGLKPHHLDLVLSDLELYVTKSKTVKDCDSKLLKILQDPAKRNAFFSNMTPKIKAVEAHLKAQAEKDGRTYHAPPHSHEMAIGLMNDLSSSAEIGMKDVTALKGFLTGLYHDYDYTQTFVNDGNYNQQGAKQLPVSNERASGQKLFEDMMSSFTSDEDRSEMQEGLALQIGRSVELSTMISAKFCTLSTHELEIRVILGDESNFRGAGTLTAENVKEAAADLKRNDTDNAIISRHDTLSSATPAKSEEMSTYLRETVGTSPVLQDESPIVQYFLKPENKESTLQFFQGMRMVNEFGAKKIQPPYPEGFAEGDSLYQLFEGKDRIAGIHQLIDAIKEGTEPAVLSSRLESLLKVKVMVKDGPVEVFDLLLKNCLSDDFLTLFNPAQQENSLQHVHGEEYKPNLGVYDRDLSTKVKAQRTTFKDIFEQATPEQKLKAMKVAMIGVTKPQGTRLPSISDTFAALSKRAYTQ